MQLQVITYLLWSLLSEVFFKPEGFKDTRLLTRVRWPFLRVPDGFPLSGRFRCSLSLTLSRPLSGFSPAWGFFQTNPLVYNLKSPSNLKPSSVYNLCSWSFLLQWLWSVLFTSQTCRSCLFSRLQRFPTTEVLCFLPTLPVQVPFVLIRFASYFFSCCGLLWFTVYPSRGSQSLGWSYRTSAVYHSAVFTTLRCCSHLRDEGLIGYIPLWPF
jgi:hypothetical protein